MITDIRLQHFRSYDDASFELAPGVNIIVGPNASGKTNLLEAILVVAKGGSFRVRDEELIQFDQPWARLDTDLADNTKRTVKITSGDDRATKQYEIAAKTYKRLTLAHSLPVVLFEPNDLQLTVAGPDRRRAYLDNLLEQTEPGYGQLRRHYARALAQRNALLKQAQSSNTQFFPWDVRLSELAGRIVRARYQLVSRLNDELSTMYHALSGTKLTVAIMYQSQWPAENYESKLLKTLGANLETDRQRGFTSNGPHREDVAILLGERPIRETGSRGETRTVILALKILELKVLEEIRQTKPLLLLDDVFSELDGKRRHALTDHLSSYQTFITTTDADITTKYFTKRANILALM